MGEIPTISLSPPSPPNESSSDEGTQSSSQSASLPSTSEMLMVSIEEDIAANTNTSLSISLSSGGTADPPLEPIKENNGNNDDDFQHIDLSDSIHTYESDFDNLESDSVGGGPVILSPRPLASIAESSGSIPSSGSSIIIANSSNSNNNGSNSNVLVALDDFRDEPELYSESVMVNDFLDDVQSWDGSLSSWRSAEIVDGSTGPEAEDDGNITQNVVNSVCDIKDAENAMDLLKRQQTSLYAAVLHRLNQSKPATQQPPPSILPPISQPLIPHLLARIQTNTSHLRASLPPTPLRRVNSTWIPGRMERKKVRFEGDRRWRDGEILDDSRDGNDKIPSAVLERVRIENLLRKMDAVGTSLDNSHSATLSSIRQHHTYSQSLTLRTLIGTLEERVRLRNLQSEVDSGKFHRFNEEPAIIQRDHITLIADILKTMPKSSTPKDEVWGRLLQRVKEKGVGGPAIVGTIG
ncbi:hypothetical protein HDU97_006093 [Phlyctochytrium planicorne]|nr:hypothetical protein HDU97_006093 [Phlyctochytrium planicorne]